MQRQRNSKFLITTVGVFLLLTACLKRVVVGPAELESSKPGAAYVLRLSNGEKLVTDHLAYADSVLILHNIIVNAKRTDVEPRQIPLEQVTSIEAVRTDWLLTTVIWTPIVAVAVLLTYLVFSGSGLEGQ